MYIVGLSTNPPTITCVNNGKNLRSYIMLDIIFATVFGGTSRLISIFLILASAATCNERICISATNPAQVAPTLSVITKVFFVVLLTRKFP